MILFERCELMELCWKIHPEDRPDFDLVTDKVMSVTRRQTQK